MILSTVRDRHLHVSAIFEKGLQEMKAARWNARGDRLTTGNTSPSRPLCLGHATVCVHTNSL